MKSIINLIKSKLIKAKGLSSEEHKAQIIERRKMIARAGIMKTKDLRLL